MKDWHATQIHNAFSSSCCEKNNKETCLCQNYCYLCREICKEAIRKGIRGPPLEGILKYIGVKYVHKGNVEKHISGSLHQWAKDKFCRETKCNQHLVNALQFR